MNSIPSTKKMHEEEREPQAMGLVWDIMHTDDGVKILEWQRFVDSSLLGYYTLDDKGYELEYRDGINRFSKSNVIREICQNKNVTTTFLGSVTPDLFPLQNSYAYRPDKDYREEIIHDFEGVDSVVIKLGAEVGGDGVYFVSMNELRKNKLPKELHTRFFPKPAKGGLKTQFEQAAVPLNGHFTVQARVTPKPMEIQKMGGLYSVWKLPTIRLVGGLYEDPAGDPYFDFWAAYYKLPSQSFLRQKSAVNVKISSKFYDRVKVISDVYRGGSALVPDEVFQDICAQMKAGLEPLAARLRDPDFERDFLIEALQSDNLADHVSAFEAMEGRDFNDAELATLLQEAYEQNPLLRLHHRNVYPSSSRQNRWAPKGFLSNARDVYTQYKI